MLFISTTFLEKQICFIVKYTYRVYCLTQIQWIKVVSISRIQLTSQIGRDKVYLRRLNQFSGPTVFLSKKCQDRFVAT